MQIINPTRYSSIRHQTATYVQFFFLKHGSPSPFLAEGFHLSGCVHFSPSRVYEGACEGLWPSPHIWFTVILLMSEASIRPLHHQTHIHARREETDASSDTSLTRGFLNSVCITVLRQECSLCFCVDSAKRHPACMSRYLKYRFRTDSVTKKRMLLPKADSLKYRVTACFTALDLLLWTQDI